MKQWSIRLYLKSITSTTRRRRTRTTISDIHSVPDPKILLVVVAIVTVVVVAAAATVALSLVVNSTMLWNCDRATYYMIRKTSFS